MSEGESVVRRLWTVAEPIHAVTYFAPESSAAYEAAGLSGFWRGYFAGRAAPMGAVAAGPVIATFYNFAPAFVRRAVPTVWERIGPDEAIAARLAGAAAGLRRMAGDSLAIEPLTETVDLLRQVVSMAGAVGRPLFAANQELDWPTDPVEALWHGTTLLREHRGDGHVVALTEAEIDGIEAHVLRLAVAGLDGAWLEPFRGWSADERAAAADRLEGRGLVDARSLAPTVEGRRLLDSIEATTDRLAGRPFEELGSAAAARLVHLLAPLATAITASGAIPFPNPIGLPAPT